MGSNEGMYWSRTGNSDGFTGVADDFGADSEELLGDTAGLGRL